MMGTKGAAAYAEKKVIKNAVQFKWKHMWVGKREQVDGFRLVLAVDRQVKDMLRQFWIVPGLFDLPFIRKGSLKLFVLGLGTGRSFDAVVHKPVTASHVIRCTAGVYRRCATTDVDVCYGGPAISHGRCETDGNDPPVSRYKDFACVGLKFTCRATTHVQATKCRCKGHVDLSICPQCNGNAMA